MAIYTLFCLVSMSTVEVMANDRVPPQLRAPFSFRKFLFFTQFFSYKKSYPKLKYDERNKTTAFWDIAWIVLKDYCPEGCKGEDLLYFLKKVKTVFFIF